MSENALVAAITADPDAAEPRLIYADWLAERGDRRGEFIRVQCDLDQLDLRDPRRVDLEYRERAFLAERGFAWKRRVRETTGATSCQFRRGMVEQLELTAGQFVDSADELFARYPLRALRLTGLDKHLPSFLACNATARLVELDLRRCLMGAKALQLLVDSPQLSNLGTLRMDQLDPTEWKISAIARSSSLSRLRCLYINNTVLDYQSFAALVTSQLGQNLTELSIAATDLSDSDFASLCYSDVFPNLRRLDISRNESLPSDSLQSLFDSRRFRQLEHLSLADCDLSSDDMSYLGRLSGPTELRSLNVDAANLQGRAAKEFAGSSCLHGLVRLSAARCQLAGDGLKQVLETGTWHTLRWLDLSNNGLDATAARHLATSDLAQQLTHLNLSHNHIGDDGLATIAGSTSLSKLNELNVTASGIGQRGLELLVRSDTLNRLTELRISIPPDIGLDRVNDWLENGIGGQLARRFGKHVCKFE